MLKSLTAAAVAVAAFGGLAAGPTVATAMPMIDPSPATVAQAATAGAIEDVRWVCGPYRCFHRPNFYPGYGYHRWHRPFYGYGYHRWHGPYGYGFHRGYRW